MKGALKLPARLASLHLKAKSYGRLVGLAFALAFALPFMLALALPFMLAFMLPFMFLFALPFIFPFALPVEAGEAAVGGGGATGAVAFAFDGAAAFTLFTLLALLALLLLSAQPAMKAAIANSTASVMNLRIEFPPLLTQRLIV